MSITKRSLLAAGLFLAVPLLQGQAQAQNSTAAANWPARPVKIVVGFAAGTSPDVFARIYGEYAARKLGVPFVIDNRPGSAGNLATDAVAKAPADGYTVLYNVSTAFTINPYIYGKLPFDAEADLVPVGTSMRQGLVLLAGPKFEASSLKDVLAMARAKPGTITHASYGAGSPSHLIMEWLKDETKTSMVHVPYRTSPITELIGGQVDLVLEPMSTAYPLITSGKVKAIAYSGPQRFAALPDLPTFAEAQPGLSMMSWHGFWTATATPPALVDKLHAVFVAAAQDSEVQRRITELSSEPLGMSRPEITQMVHRDAGIYSAIVKARNIRVD